MAFELECMLSLDAFAAKPQGAEVAIMRNRFERFRGTSRELAGKVGVGHAFMPAVMAGGFSSGDWASQQLFALDFDNKDGIILPAAAVMRAHSAGIAVAFVYRTYSSTGARPRFRMAVALSRPLEDAGEARDGIARLLGLFPEADQACKDLARMFYGSSSGAAVVDEEPADLSAVTALPMPAPAAPHGERTNGLFCGFGDSAFLAELKRNYPLFERARASTDKQPYQRGFTVYFPGRCPVCGHNDCFRYYPDENSWHCFSSSNRTGISGGSAVDYVMATQGLGTGSEAFKQAVRMMEQREA